MSTEKQQEHLKRHVDETEDMQPDVEKQAKWMRSSLKI